MINNANPATTPGDQGPALVPETVEAPTGVPSDTPLAGTMPAAEVGTPDRVVADVVSAQASGNPGAYTFSVEIASPDEGCDRYADWWEVVTPEGELIYRHILLHSHVNEQPFERAGGPVEVDADTVVVIRAHMHPDGYGGQVLRGSVADGFTEAAADPDFAGDLESAPPQPRDCGF